MAHGTCIGRDRTAPAESGKGPRNKKIMIAGMGKKGGSQSANERVRGGQIRDGKQTWKLTVHPLRTCLLHSLKERGQVTLPGRQPHP